MPAAPVGDGRMLLDYAQFRDRPFFIRNEGMTMPGPPYRLGGTPARDSAIVCSIALQFGADLEIIRKALCRDSRGHASGPLPAALDRVANGGAL